MGIFLFVAFIAGALTVLAPCTIALLPVIVGGTLAGEKSVRRALVVTTSLGVSVILFTLVLKVSSTFIAVPQQFWEILSGGIIALIGIAMVYPALWDNLPFVNRLNRGSNKAMSAGYMRQNLWGDILVGASLGPVFSSCSPTYFLIIAAILPMSTLAGMTDLLAYAIGLCGMLLVVAVAGQQLVDYFNIAADPTGWFRRAIGVLFILIGLAIASGFEQEFELAFANTNLINLSGIEKNLLHGVPSTPSVTGDAPEITQPSGFLNTAGQPITLAGLRGKVVLVDFWDYSCINCEREIPYVEAWYKKYVDEGLVVVGVHTPEFAFEKLPSNVAAAAKSLGITYPIVLDNDYGTWNAFHNEYWPQIYLINSDGDIVYSHSGEGDYPETEAAIQAALSERDTKLGLPDTVSTGIVNPAGAVEADGSQLGSPETYFGSDRNEYLGNGSQGTQGKQTLSIPATLSPNTLYLGGLWDFSSQYAETADTNAQIAYEFDARNVYMVATGNPSAKIRILLDGKELGSSAGADVGADSTMTVDTDKLYKLVSLPAYGVHTLQIQLESGTLDAYTFTFG